MTRLTDRLIAERTVVAVILLNAVALFALGFVAPGSGAQRLWFAVDYAAVVFFAVEAALKMGKRGFGGYWSSWWNRFDFVVTALSLPVLLAPLVDLHELGGVLVLRLGRLFRLFRVMRFIPNRHHLAAGISRALKASVGVFIALVLINVILAMGASYLFGDLAPELFGDPLRACYNLFRIFTVEGWYEVPELLAERASSPAWGWLARAYCVACLLVGGILGLSLANAVFVDEMMMDNTDELEAKVDLLLDEVRALRRELAAGRAES